MINTISYFGYTIPWYLMRQPCTIGFMAKPSNTHAGSKILIAFGLAIRQSRAEMGLSQEALAVDANMDRSYVGGIERGEHNITVMNVVKLADALNTKPSLLFEKAGL